MPTPKKRKRQVTKRAQTTKEQVSKEKVSVRNIDSVKFHFLKGPDFRSVHVDGAFGGLSTKGFLHLTVYAERNAIPREVTYEIRDGRLGDEILSKRVGKDGIVRQMEVGLVMNEETARDIRNWLDKRLEDFEERRRLIQEKIKKEGGSK